MKKLALLGMLLTVSSNVLFAEDQCQTGPDQATSADAQQKAEKSKEGDSKILVQDEKK